MPGTEKSLRAHFLKDLVRIDIAVVRVARVGNVQPILEPFEHLLAAAGARLQVHEEEAGVSAATRPARAGKGGDVFHVGVRQHDAGDGLLVFLHGIKGNALLRHGDSKDEAAVFAGQESFGNADEEIGGDDDDGDGEQEGCEAVPQDLPQAPIVGAQHAHESRARRG